MKVCFVGGGNMASAMISGLLADPSISAQVSVIEPVAESRASLAARYRVSIFADAGPTLAGADVYVLAVKPQNLRVACTAIAPYVGSAFVLSIAAGVRTREICHWLGGYENVVRSMPNTPAMIQQGITGVFARAGVAVADRHRAERLLSTLGDVIWVDREDQLDAVTAVSGSGPAYVFYAIEALERAAVELGLPAADARRLALATFSGAAALAKQSADDPATLRAKVTSKGGTTAAAISLMQTHGLADTWVAATKAAATRARELGDEMAKG